MNCNRYFFFLNSEAKVVFSALTHVLSKRPNYIYCKKLYENKS